MIISFNNPSYGRIVLIGLLVSRFERLSLGDVVLTSIYVSINQSSISGPLTADKIGEVAITTDDVERCNGFHCIATVCSTTTILSFTVPISEEITC